MNDRLRICPRCEMRECDHLERRLADALASVGTGVMNLDYMSGRVWVASLGRRGEVYGRTMFVELKFEADVLARGQDYTLRDITGVLDTGRGQMEQRAFTVWEVADGFRMGTYHHAYRVEDDEVRSLAQIAELLQSWMRDGSLPSALSRHAKEGAP